jgi:hypothetical protein
MKRLKFLASTIASVAARTIRGSMRTFRSEQARASTILGHSGVYSSSATFFKAQSILGLGKAHWQMLSDRCYIEQGFWQVITREPQFREDMCPC